MRVAGIGTWFGLIKSQDRTHDHPQTQDDSGIGYIELTYLTFLAVVMRALGAISDAPPRNASF